MTDDHDMCEWVNVSSGTSSKIQRAIKWLCVLLLCGKFSWSWCCIL